MYREARQPTFRHLAFFATIGLLVIVAPPLLAQGGTALLTGTVTDQTNAVLPGATVTVTNEESGVERVAATDEAGRYRVPALTPGRYRVSAELAAFEKVIKTSIVLRIGQEAVIYFTLKVQTLQEAVVVTGESPLVETRKSETATKVSEQQIQNLPVNTREWINLAVLTPGVSQDNIRGFYNNANVGAGTRWYANAFVVDGVTNTWAEMGEPRQNFPMDSIQEFQVTPFLFKAEHGLATGGLLTAVTKSGTNQFRGNAFLYVRDKALNARGFFEKEKPDFKRYQFGGSLGGPIVKNRTHFFASYERTNLDHFFTVHTRGAFPEEEGTFPQDDFRQMFTVRFDHQFSPKHSLMARYAQEDEHQEKIGAGGIVVPGFTQEIPRRAGVVTHSWLPTERAANELRIQYAFAAYQIWPGGSPRSFKKNGVFDAERFAVLDQVIVRPSLRKGFDWADVGPETRIQIRDDFSYFKSGWKGEHAFKAGFDYSWVDFSDDWSGNPNGTYFFATDRPFNPAAPSTHPFLFTAFAPQSLLEAAQTGRFPATWNTNLKTQYYSAYFQDDWKPTSGLTLNLGLRYDLQVGVFNKDLDRSISPFIEADERGDYNNFGPRAGFAWDLKGDSRSVLRGGYGLYYQNIRTLAQFGERRNFQYIFVFIPNPGFPDPFGGKSFLEFASTAAPSISTLSNDLVNPYAHQASLGFSQQTGADLAISVDFTYNRGQANIVQRDVNYFATSADRLAGVRPTREFARITQQQNDGESEYRALMVRVDKRFSRRYQLMASYALSKSEDFPDILPADHFDISAEWAPDQTDRRHRLVLSGIVELPYGIQLSGIADLRSILPFDVTAGRDLNRDTIGFDRPPGVTRNQGCRDLDLGAVNAYRAANGLPAVTSVTCQGYASIDLRVSKLFGLGPDRSLEIFAQAFNLFNRTNFNTLSGGQLAFGLVGNALSPSFGKALSAQAARQIEVAARIRF